MSRFCSYFYSNKVQENVCLLEVNSCVMIYDVIAGIRDLFQHLKSLGSKACMNRDGSEHQTLKADSQKTCSFNFLLQLICFEKPLSTIWQITVSFHLAGNQPAQKRNDDVHMNPNEG
jgi:hypothetical protein